jgi:hypothetical protein
LGGSIVISRAVNRRQPGRKWLTALAITGLIAGTLMITGSAAGFAQSNWELDKNATNTLTSTHLGALQTSATSTTLTITVCELVAAPAQPFTIQIDAEHMSVTSIASTTGGTGGCAFSDPALTALDSRVWTVTRHTDGTTAAAHSGSAPRADVTGINLSGAPTGHDWNQVFTAPVTNGTRDCSSIGATACAFKNRPNTGTASSSNGFTGPTTFTQTSGDLQTISQWVWTNQSVPDADRIDNAYAAKYAGPPQDIYVGMDRYAVNGSKDIGFWFFAEKVGPLDGGGFSGAHCYAGQTTDNCPTPPHGDLLILTTFSAGGGTTTARAYEWVGNGPGAATSSDGALNFLGSFGDCVPGNPTDKGCATTANSTVTAPWANLEKATGASANTFYAGGFMEGGLNLTALGETGCFSSFMGVSRSSPSLTAQPKAFIGGQFESCTTSTVTTPEDSSGTDITNGTISIGTGSVQAKDLATVSGNGSSAKPSGTVKFYICGPAATDALAQCDGTVTPPSNGYHFGTDPTLVPGTTNSTATSSLVTLTEVGHYCFRADYQGDGTYPASSDNALTECFSVTPVTPTLLTTASGGGQVPATISDSALLSGTATRPGTGGIGSDGSINPTTAGLPANGSISFTAYGPNDCTTVALATTSRDVSGNGTYPTALQTAVSFSATAVGSYTFVASYSGSSPNTGGVTATACGSQPAAETVTTTDSSSLLTDQTWVPNDHVQITSAGGLALSGKAVFTLYDNGTCDGNVLYTNGPTGTAVSGASGSTFDSANTTHVNATATVSWKVAYTSNNSTTGSTSSCESTALTITNNPGYAPLP